MVRGSRPLLWSVRAISLLGLVSLSLTGEIGIGYLTFSWLAWAISLGFDQRPELQETLRRFETLAVAALITVFLIDFFPLHQTVFVAVTHFLILFQIFKLVGLKERKDCFQIFLFGFFQILAACTLSVDAWHAIVLLLFIPSAAFALFWHHVERENELNKLDFPKSSLKPYSRMSMGISLGSLPLVLGLTLGVFIVFPRLTINASLPGFTNNKIGYNDQINLGQSGILENQDSAVMWLAFPVEGDRRRWNGYLRGSTLQQFDGRQWTAHRERNSFTLYPDVNGVFIIEAQRLQTRRLRQAVTLVDTSATTLFISGRPQQVIAPLPTLQRDSSGSLRWTARWQRPLRYEVLSAVDERQSQPPAKRPDNLEVDLTLPAIPLSRIAALTRQVAGSGSDRSRVLAIETYLRNTYQYSLDLGAGGSPNPVDDFLFVRKKGPCGHFASAMALMLRLEKIPARIATGYLRGEWNEPANQYLIRERDAHAWVEAYIQGAGWTVFDPSPRQNADAGATAARRRWQSVRQYWDYMGLKWNRFVIQYDLYSQLRAFEKLRSSSEKMNTGISRWFSGGSKRIEPNASNREDSEESNPFPFRGLIVVAMVGAAFWFIGRKQSRLHKSPAVTDYERFLRQMAQQGSIKGATETGWEFAHRAASEHPEQKEVVWKTTRRYYDSRFGGRS